MPTPVQKLQWLNTLLRNLPDNPNLPSPLPQRSQYPFRNFVIPQDYIEKTESELGGLNEAFKSIFGWQTRTTGDGIIEIKERGPGIEGIVVVFQRYLEKYPGDQVLEKWLDDIIQGAEQVYKRTKTKVSTQSN